MSSFLSTATLSPDELFSLLDLAARGKSSGWSDFSTALAGKVIGLLFFNTSLRTRASFLSGIARLGADAVPLEAGSQTWSMEFEEGVLMNGDKSEHVKEAARVLSGYFDVLGVRSFARLESWEEDRQDRVIRGFEQHLTIPLINMESAVWHPCQALADALTLCELFSEELRQRTFVLSWAPHPKQLPMAVPNSTLLIAAQLGMNIRLVCPTGYELAPEIMSQVSQVSEEQQSSFEVYHSQGEGFKHADIVYAKSWTPPRFIGKHDAELAEREKLQDWTVTSKQMSCTNSARFMHCLPVRRNVVVSDDILDGPCSVVTQQAHNRLHVQNALLLNMLLKGEVL